MRLRVFQGQDDLAMASAVELRDAIRQKPDLLCCFAAGRTQIPTYTILADWAKKGELDLSRLRVVGLDEIIGASRAGREGFYYFLDTHLFGPAGIRDEQVVFLDPKAQDMRAECERIDRWLDEHGPIEFLLLGIGGNGHIGYNEPGADPEARSHAVKLEQSSIEAAQTYFDHAFDADTGVTLGLRDLLMATRTVVQATGSGKQPVVESLRKGDILREVPVTLLLGNPGTVDFFIDEAASTGKETPIL